MQRSLCLFLPEFRLWTEYKVEIFRRYKLVIKITNSTVLNKFQSYSRISALGPEGHSTSRFKRAMCISYRPDVDVHKGEGSGPSSLLWAHVNRGEGVENPIFLWTS